MHSISLSCILILAGIALVHAGSKQSNPFNQPKPGFIPTLSDKVPRSRRMNQYAARNSPGTFTDMPDHVKQEDTSNSGEFQEHVIPDFLQFPQEYNDHGEKLVDWDGKQRMPIPRRQGNDGSGDRIHPTGRKITLPAPISTTTTTGALEWLRNIHASPTTMQDFVDFVLDLAKEFILDHHPLPSQVTQYIPQGYLDYIAPHTITADTLKELNTVFKTKMERQLQYDGLAWTILIGSGQGQHQVIWDLYRRNPRMFGGAIPEAKLILSVNKQHQGRGRIPVLEWNLSKHTVTTRFHTMSS